MRSSLYQVVTPRGLHILLLISSFFISQGCTITNLQRVDVKAPPIQHAIHITETPQQGELIARGFLSWNQDPYTQTRIKEHTDVNENGVFEVEPIEGENAFIERAGVNVFPFRDDNFAWEAPKWQGGMEFEMQLLKSLALTGGLGYANLDGSLQMSQNLGLGLSLESDTWASRFDASLAFQSSRFNIEAVRGRNNELSGNTERRVTFIEIEDQDHYVDPAFGFTLNSKRQEWPVNYFFNYMLGRQTFYDVQDRFLFESGIEGFDFKYSETYNAIAAGFYKNLADNNRLLFGFRWMKFADDRDQMALFKLFMQYEFRLF